MVDSLLSLLAPYPCYSCGQLGSILCDNCKYNIVSENFDVCIICAGACGPRGVCGRCKTPFSRAICIGERTGELRRLIDAYKFENARAAHKVLAELLSMKIGTLPSSVVVVPIPTLASHIRQRGYDHTLLVARKLARRQNVSLNTTLLKRVTKTRQRGATKKQRAIQAKEAFTSAAQVDGGFFLLVDDVVTTGATLIAAAKTLLKCGADEVWVCAVAKQQIDN